jgi:hypothetical protein
MNYNHLYGWFGGHQQTRRRSFIPPPYDTNNLRHDEFMASLAVMTAGGDQARLDCLFSRDWPQSFIHAVFAEATGLPIIEFAQSYQTPRGHIDCTRAIRTLVMPAGLDTFTAIQLPILETEIYPYLNLPVIMGRPQVTSFMPPHWPWTEVLEPLVQLDFSPRHSYTFPGTPVMYEPMTAGLNGFHNYTPPPPAWPPSLAYTPGQQRQVADFPQVGHSTFASAATAGELSREEQTRIWVENSINNNNNAPSEDVVDG